ncbi:MAG: 6-phospho-beta-glucosidase [Defluviitaleaceae bacterium]|nr:6-phospho-beta-glucosidase [Defluviitaleaceae bacterium]
MKIAIIGAGSTYTPELTEGLINRKGIMPVSNAVLMDIDARKLDIVGNLTRRMIKHSGMECNVDLTDEYDRALDGADFIFVQMRVGQLPARILDEKIPLKYDLIGQETTGIGGFFKALRTIPVLMDLTERVKRLCPDAWLLNFTNPSGICAQALLEHTNVKTIGLCNAPIGIMANPVEKFAEEIGGNETEIDYVGLNHLSFLTSIRAGKRDFLREAVEGNDELLEKLDGQMGFGKDVIRKIKAVPSYYLQYFIHPRESLKKLHASEKTRGEECMEIEEELLKMYTDASLFVKPEQLSKRGGAMYSEAACSLAESIFTDNRKIHVVNARNNGAIPYMAPDDIVETRAVVGKNGAETLSAKEAGGEYIQGIMQAIKTYERLTVKAALTGCRDSAIAALMANPLVGDYDAAVGCFNEMLEAHKKYLPLFFAG